MVSVNRLASLLQQLCRLFSLNILNSHYWRSADFHSITSLFRSNQSWTEFLFLATQSCSFLVARDQKSGPSTSPSFSEAQSGWNHALISCDQQQHRKEQLTKMAPLRCNQGRQSWTLSCPWVSCARSWGEGAWRPAWNIDAAWWSNWCWFPSPKDVLPVWRLALSDSDGSSSEGSQGPFL